MKTLTKLFCTALVAGLLFAGCAEEGEKPVTPPEGDDPAATITKQTVCTLMGGKEKPINKEIFADHNGKRVYLCCKGCIAKFEADADNIIKNMEDEGITLDTTPTDSSDANNVSDVKLTAKTTTSTATGCCPSKKATETKSGCPSEAAKATETKSGCPSKKATDDETATATGGCCPKK